MKFSHSLQFNAVPEWSSKYIAYTTLKKLIYSLQRDSLKAGGGDLESAHLITNESRADQDPSTVFLAALDAELTKVDDFYQVQESYIFKGIEELIVDIENFEAELDGVNFSKPADFGRFSLNRKKLSGSASGGVAPSDTSFEHYQTETDREMQEEDENDDEDSGEERGRPKNRPLEHTKSIDHYLKSPKTPDVWNNLNNYTSTLPPQLLILSENRVILRKRIIGLFTTLSELKSYIELNNTGFKKALKKFDKSLNTNLKDGYLSTLR